MTLGFVKPINGNKISPGKNIRKRRWEFINYKGLIGFENGLEFFSYSILGYMDDRHEANRELNSMTIFLCLSDTSFCSPTSFAIS